MCSPQLYVCIVSDHNLPDLEAVLTFTPATVVLLATPGFAEPARRLRQQIEHALPGCQVLQPSVPIRGDSLTEAQQWATHDLSPQLSRLSERAVLNLTGGTKALALALLHGHHWTECHYKAFQRPLLERFTLRQGQPAPLPDHELKAAGIDQAVRLYCDIRHTPHRPSACGLALARQLWQGLEQGDAGLLALFKVFNRVWALERDEPHWKHNTVGWPRHTLNQAVLPWFEQLQQLDPEHIYSDEQQLYFPGNRRNRKESGLRQWISGGWLEELVYYWLSQVIPEQQLALNVRSQTNPDNHSQREADVLLLHKGVTWVMEIKADVPPGHALSDMENQLSSHAERYGKTRKVLFIGPELRKKLEKNNKWESFAGRCKGNRVDLCHDQPSLYASLGIASEQ